MVDLLTPFKHASRHAPGGDDPNVALSDNFVVTSATANLPNERVITAGDGITFTDGGAGGNLTIDQDYIELARRRVGFVDDFWTPLSTGTAAGPGSFVVIVSGTGASTQNFSTDDNSVFGAISLMTGTTATGRAAACHMVAGSTMMRLGLGVTTLSVRVKLTTVSDATNRFQVTIGLISAATLAVPVDGIYFSYLDTDSANWMINASNESTRTSTSSGIAVSGTNWYTLKIVVNAASTSAEFFIDGVSVGTIANANVPSGSGDQVGVVIGIFKSVGTAGRFLNVDYCALQIDLTTARP